MYSSVSHSPDLFNKWNSSVHLLFRLASPPQYYYAVHLVDARGCSFVFTAVRYSLYECTISVGGRLLPAVCYHEQYTADVLVSVPQCNIQESLS